MRLAANVEETVVWSSDVQFADGPSTATCLLQCASSLDRVNGAHLFLSELCTKGSPRRRRVRGLSSLDTLAVPVPVVHVVSRLKNHLHDGQESFSSGPRAHLRRITSTLPSPSPGPDGDHKKAHPLFTTVHASERVVPRSPNSRGFNSITSPRGVPVAAVSSRLVRSRAVDKPQPSSGTGARRGRGPSIGPNGLRKTDRSRRVEETGALVGR
jgi:hypothetical protein